MHTVSSEVEPAVYRLADVARLLGVHRVTVVAWAESGQLPATKLGRTWVFPRTLIDAIVAGTAREAASPPVEVAS